MPAPALPREVKLGAKGRDVRAYQRALRKAGDRPKEAKTTNVFDEQMDAEVRAFQRTAGLLVDGEIGTNTFAKLLPYLDGWGKRLLRAVRPDVPSSIRQKVVASAFVGYQNRDSIRYTQSNRRMQGIRDRIRPPRFPQYEDCSSFATWCYWAAGGPDPNGLNYSGGGWTGTQIGRGVECPNPRPGDLVFYGPSHWSIKPRRGLRRERQRRQPRPGERALSLSDGLQPGLEGRAPASEELFGLREAGRNVRTHP